MADYDQQSLDFPSPQRPPPLDPLEANMSLGSSPQTPVANGRDNGVGAGPEAGARPDMSQQVREVLESEIGVATMLDRLKQSVASAKEFALFLKKRSALEDEHSKGMKKLCRMTQDNVHHSDHRQGSFGRSYDDMLSIHDRMAENGLQFASSLIQMHEDLLEVAAIAEKHRKGLKQSGLSAEQHLAELETAMRKSKSKYDSLSEDYDRVRTGESRQGGKVFGFKGTKSVAQQEEDLLRKVQAADTDYKAKVQSYQSEKASMISTTRPDTIKTLNDCVRECDSATTLQMQKFASFNEKLLLSNGLVISPLRNHGAFSSQHSKSMKEVIAAVDNNKDLEDYILSFHTKVPPRGADPKYEPNPVLHPPGQNNMSMTQMTRMHQQQLHTQQPAQNHQRSPSQVQLAPGSMESRTGALDAPLSGSNLGPPLTIQTGSRPPSQQTGHDRSYSHGDILTQASMLPQQSTYSQRNSAQAAPPSQHQRYANGGSTSLTGPPQLGALPFQSELPARDPSPPRQGGQPLYMSQGAPSYQQTGSARSVSPPAAPSVPSVSTKQVFGVSLNRLYERDGLAVPMVVYQCIQAVDLFGLNMEGIYRISGSANHIQKLKSMFDTDSDSRNLDFRNPENFFHDVNSVTGLLKQFFRDLPDPLLTAEHYAGFIDAARSDDEVIRRDSLHAIINSLPDPNYATLRALTLHLHRVLDNSSATRMSTQNLAIVFGPTLMGNVPGSNIADAGWQVKVVETILQNTYQIFDED